VAAAETIVDQVAQELRAHGSYDSYFEAQRAAYEDDLRRLEGARAQSPLLEVGGYPFHFSRCLALAGYTFQSVDLNPERARSWLVDRGIKTIHCDLEQQALPLPDSAVETVVLSETFEHLRVDPLFALRQIARVLRHGGLLYLTTPNFYRVGNVLRFVLGLGLSNDPLHEYEKLESVGHMGHVREYTTREMSRLLSHAGFAQIEIDRRVLRSRHGQLVDLVHTALVPFRPNLVICARRR
jgi:SAM-dependent methyltransferase